MLAVHQEGGRIARRYLRQIAGLGDLRRGLIRHDQPESAGLVVPSSVTANAVARAALGPHPCLLLPASARRLLTDIQHAQFTDDHPDQRSTTTTLTLATSQSRISSPRSVSLRSPILTNERVAQRPATPGGVAFV